MNHTTLSRALPPHPGNITTAVTAPAATSPLRRGSGGWTIARKAGLRTRQENAAQEQQP